MDNPAPSAPARALRILIVDDNVAAALSLKWLVETMGDTADVCHDGETALTQAAATHPDLILLDLAMRGLNGLEVCRTLRADPAFRHTAIIAQTGWGDDAMRARTKAAGFSLHLTKPVDVSRLKDALASLRTTVRRVA